MTIGQTRDVCSFEGVGKFRFHKKLFQCTYLQT